MREDNHGYFSKEGPESGLDRLGSVSVRVDNLVKGLRPPEAAARSAALDKIVNTNNRQPSDQGRHPLSGNLSLGHPLMRRCRLNMVSISCP
jgi:hypothetical protein